MFSGCSLDDLWTIFWTCVLLGCLQVNNVILIETGITLVNLEISMSDMRKRDSSRITSFAFVASN